MKLKQEFVIRNIAGDNILIPIVNKTDKFDGILSLNETGIFMWKQLEQEKEIDEIVNALIEEYDVNEKKATEDVNKFVGDLVKLGII